MHFILIKPVFSDHLSYVTLFQCSLERSHKTGLTVYLFYNYPDREGSDSINRFNPATILFLSQARTWISNVICHGLILCSLTWGKRWFFILLIVWWCYATFNNISVISWRSVLLVEDSEKTTDMSQVTDKLYHIMLYILSWSRFKLTTSVVIGTDCIGSCKSN
jgi:hypothetical protein